MSLPEPHTSVSRLPPAAHLPASSLLGTGAASALWFWLACIATLLMLCTVGVSAFIRLAQAEHVCKHWLSCAGGADISQALSAWVSGARQVHRVLATGFLALALVLALGTRTTGLRHPARLALGVLALSLGLAALGIIGRNSTVPAVVLGNLLGGMLTLTLCWRLVLALHPARTWHSSRLQQTSFWVLLVLWALVATGAWPAPPGTPTVCNSLTACLQAIAQPATAPLPAYLRAVHVLVTWLLLPLLVHLSWLAWRSRRPWLALGVIVLTLAQWWLGHRLASAALLPVVAHNLLAALMLALLSGLRRPR